jgi:hypothetical protein
MFCYYNDGTRLVPLTHFCGHFLDINKIVLSYFALHYLFEYLCVSLTYFISYF